MRKKKTKVLDIHSEHTTLEELQEELRANHLRLEERKVGICSGKDTTPLMSAAGFGNVEIVKFLLSLEANIEAKDQVSNYLCPFDMNLVYELFVALSLTCFFFHCMYVSRVQYGHNSLILATVQGHVDTVQLLLNVGACINHDDIVPNQLLIN